MIDAAIKVVAKRGFDGAPVDEIARAAGFSIGALYGNFAGKDDLFLAVYDAHVTWFEQELAGLDLADPGAALAGSFARLDERAARAQFLVFVEFWSYAVRRPKLRRELARRMGALREAVAARLAERDGPLRCPPTRSPCCCSPRGAGSRSSGWPTRPRSTPTRSAACSAAHSHSERSLFLCACSRCRTSTTSPTATSSSAASASTSRRPARASRSSSCTAGRSTGGTGAT